MVYLAICLDVKSLFVTLVSFAKPIIDDLAKSFVENLQKDIFFLQQLHSAIEHLLNNCTILKNVDVAKFNVLILSRGYLHIIEVLFRHAKHKFLNIQH